MACKFDYIDKVKLDSTSKKDIPISAVKFKELPLDEFLANKHVELAQKILSFDKFSLKQYSKVKTGDPSLQKYIILPYGDSKTNIDRRKDLLDYIKAINAEEGLDLIGTKEVELNGKLHELIFIDVRPMIDDMLSEGTSAVYDRQDAEDFVDDSSYYEVFMKSMFKNSQLNEAQTNEEYVEECTEKFFPIILNLKSKLSTYVANPAETSTPESKRFDKEVRYLLHLLNNPTGANQVSAVFKFLAEAKNFADRSYNTMYKKGGLIDQYNAIINRSALTEISQDKQAKLSDLAREIDKIKNRLYLFDYLKEVQTELKQSGANDNVFEIYNKFKLELEVKRLFVQEGKPENDADVLLDSIFSTSFESTLDFRKSVTIALFDNGIKTPDMFFEGFRFKDKTRIDSNNEVVDAFTLSESIDNSVINMGKLIESTKELTLDIAAATLYPQYLTAWSEHADAKERSFKKSYEQFRNALLLSEENPSLINLWVGSGEQQTDDIIFATARTLFDALRKQDYETFQNGQRAFATLNEIFKGTKDALSDTKRKALDDEFTSSILEIEEGSPVTRMLKTGPQTYSETKTIYDGANDKQEVTTIHTSIKEVKDILGNVIEVQLENDKSGDEVWLVLTNDFGTETWVKAKRTKALIHEFSYREGLENKVFQVGLDREVAKIIDMWETISSSEDGDHIAELNELSANLRYSPYNSAILGFIERRLESISKDYEVEDMDETMNLTSLKGLLYAGFESHHKVFTNQQETEVALDHLESISGQSIRTGPFVPERKARTWLTRNTRAVDVKLSEKSKKYNIIYNLTKGGFDSVVTTGSGVDTRVLVQRTNGDMEFLRIELIGTGVKFFNNQGALVPIEEIESYFKKSGALKRNNPAVYAKKEEELTHEKRMQDSQYRNYYLFLKGKHDAANDEVSIGRLEHYKFPQIPAKDTMSIFQQLKDKGKAAKSGKKVVQGTIDMAKAYKNNVEEVPYTNKKGEFTDEKGNLLPKGSKPKTYLRNRRDLDGYDSRILQPKYTTRLSNQNEVESDLFISFMTFEDSVGKYKALYDLEPQMRFLKIITSGTRTKNGELSFFGGRLKKTGKNTNKYTDVQTASARNTAQAIEQMLNHYVYDDNKVRDEWAGKINTQKIATALKGLNAYQVLAFNWVAGFTNLEVGVFNNFSAGIGGKFGISTEAIKDGYKEYAKRVIEAVTSKYKSKNLYERDHMTQLAIVFDAIKGNEVAPGEVFGKQTTAIKKAHSLLFATSAIPEHANQLPLMIAYMKTYKVNPITGFTMWDAYLKGSTGEVTINFKDEEGNELPTSTMNDFMRNLDAINSEAHGNYGKYQTSMLERYAIGGLFMQFGRWIYPSLRSRFHTGGYDKQSQRFIERGHSLWYLKELTGDLFKNVSENLNLGKEENVNVTGLFKAIAVGVKDTAINMTVKQATYILNHIFQGTIAKNSPKVNKWLFGDREDLDKLIIAEELEIMPEETQEEFDNRVLKVFNNRRTALTRAAMETTWATMAMLMGLLLAAAADDDDGPAKKWLLQSLEIQARRFSNDLGLFTININPFSSVDFFVKKINDPASVNNLIANNIKMITQIAGFNFGEDGFNMKFNDVYEKGGAGYEKGDSKLIRAVRKSAFSPLHQVYKFLTPDEQKSTLDLLNKNSIFSDTGN